MKINDILNENFADGKNPQDKGDSKRLGVPTHASVGTLRKVAKQGGRKGQLAHWMANMKAGRAKNESEGEPEGLPHLTKELLTHIVQQIGTEGAHAIIKSLEWGDGAADELLDLIQHDLEQDISMAESVKQRLDPSCWSGYHKEGTKIKGGTRVNNCVPNESIDEDWQKVNKHDKTDGMSKKAVSAYRREHPGSKLKTAVTKKPSELKAGSKDANRRKSFCARMSGVDGPMKDEKGRPTAKAKALKRWNC